MMSKPNVHVFGAANVDITGFPYQKLIYRDANKGYMKTSAGGVGRNIAENLVRLDFKVDFTGIFGDDPLSDFLVKDCRAKALNIDKSLFVEKASASTFIAIMDEQKDLAVGISAMNLYDDLPPEVFIGHLPKAIDSSYIVMETNLHTEILQAIVAKYPGQKFVLDTVSGKKSLRALPVLSDLYLLKTNLLEAEMMSGIPVEKASDLQKLVGYFTDKGVEKVFITLGKDGVIYGDRNRIAQKPAIPSKVVNTIGAGDSFVAGLIYADSMGLSLDKMAEYGMKAATITVQHEAAVSPYMSRQKLEL